jgi:hypothetical protein
MIYYFTEDDSLTRVRGADIRAALVYAGHKVVKGRPRASSHGDIWLHGLGYDGNPPMEASLVNELMAFAGPVVLYQLCDAESMWFSRIPDALGARARMFLRNHWPEDRDLIPERYRERIGWMPPMMPRMPAYPGKPLAERSGGAIFYGTRTGKLNLPGDKNAREETVRIMRRSGLPFQGGLTPHSDAAYTPPPELVVPRTNERTHLRRLLDSKMCLAPWGNHKLTYRLFEGLAARCLVVAQSIGGVAFLDGSLRPGKEYVEVAPDLSDLPNVVEHYLSHPDEAQRIADAGHAHFCRYFEPRGHLISRWTFEASVASWGDLYRPPEHRDVIAGSRGMLARLFPDRF